MYIKNTQTLDVNTYQEMVYDMLYKESIVEMNIIDGNVSLEEAVRIVSKMTGIEKEVLLTGAKKHSFVAIMENPSLLEITPEQEEAISELREILDYKVGVIE